MIKSGFFTPIYSIRSIGIGSETINGSFVNSYISERPIMLGHCVYRKKKVFLFTHFFSCCFEMKARASNRSN